MLTLLALAALALPSTPAVAPCPPNVTRNAGVAVAAPSGVQRLATCIVPDTTRRRRAAQHSDLYYTRLTIHRWASYATIPLFVAQYVVGQDLYDGDDGNGGDDDDDGGGNKSLHVGLGVSIGVLFGVNTLTGGWNLVEGWHDTGVKQKAHAALMLLSDAGFLATALTTPEGSERKSTHRALAITSGVTALVGYALMIPELLH
jgi:hypothetical protein